MSDEELEIAKALQLPWYNPSMEQPAFPLLVSEQLVIENAPNIKHLDVSELNVSADGKHATRRLFARCRDDQEGAPFWCMVQA